MTQHAGKTALGQQKTESKQKTRGTLSLEFCVDTGARDDFDDRKAKNTSFKEITQQINMSVLLCNSCESSALGFTSSICDSKTKLGQLK